MTATEFRPGQRFDADDNRWVDAKEILGNDRVTLGPVASHSWLHQPEHIAFQLARYRAAAALIGDAGNIVEWGCGEGIGARILVKGRGLYIGIDSDADAIAIAHAHQHMRPLTIFSVEDILLPIRRMAQSDAVVSLDVIEHIPADREDAFMANAVAALADHGVMVVGTPNKVAEHLASPQSKAGHVNLYTHERLRALMAKHFRVVQMMGMQDTAVHFGHPEMAHYLIAVGIGPRRES